MTLEIQVLDWNRHNIVAWLNLLIGHQPFPLDNWISNGNAYYNICLFGHTFVQNIQSRDFDLTGLIIITLASPR